MHKYEKTIPYTCVCGIERADWEGDSCRDCHEDLAMMHVKIEENGRAICVKLCLICFMKREYTHADKSKKNVTQLEMDLKCYKGRKLAEHMRNSIRESIREFKKRVANVRK